MREIHENNTQYQTGKVTQPRGGSPLVAVLLVAVVLLCGLITILSLMNIRLTLALKEQEDSSALQLQSASSSNRATVSQPQHSTPDAFMEPQLPVGNLGASIPQGGLNAQQIYENCIDSVVTVRGSNTGTGVIIAEEGYIVTNSRVVDGAQSVTVTLSDQREFAASLVGADSVTDLAVLRIQAEELSAAHFGDSAVLQVGDEVCTIGGADRNNAVTNGKVSAIEQGTIPLIRTDGSRPAENVSGPLIDRLGRVVAIRVMLPDAQENFDVAIPISTVRQIAGELIRQGYVSGRPGLGVDCEPVSERYQHLYNLPGGLYVTQILSDLAGDSLAAGDILLTLDGQPITTREDLKQALYRFAAGDSANVEIFRDGTRLNLTVTFDEAKG